jgi:hypothetical protein
MTPPRPASPASSKNRANVLIDRILIEHPDRLDDLAAALLASPEVIGAYRTGRAVPIERQMLLAAYAIERAPTHARLGYLLRGQVRAAIAFEARETETHNGPPPRELWR